MRFLKISKGNKKRNDVLNDVLNIQKKKNK